MEIKISNPEEVKLQIARCYAATSCYLDDLLKDRSILMKTFEMIEQTHQTVSRRRRESELAFEQAKRSSFQDSDLSILDSYMQQIEKCEENLQTCDQLHEEMNRIQREYRIIEQHCGALADTCKTVAEKTGRILDLIMQAK